jgi:hypothetical protein
VRDGGSDDLPVSDDHVGTDRERDRQRERQTERDRERERMDGWMILEKNERMGEELGFCF